jgi:hypothetical protein
VAFKELLKIFLVIYFVFIAFTDFNNGSMQMSIISLTMSIAEEHSLIVDDHIFSKKDLSFHNGHYYSGLSPGLSFILVPHYLIYGKWLSNKLPFSSAGGYSFIFSPFSTSLISAVCFVFFYLYLLSLGITNNISKALTFLCSFGTLILVYSSTLSSRVIAASLSIIIMYLSYTFKESGSKNRYTIFFIGLLLGLAVLFDYGAILYTPLFSFYILYCNWRHNIPISGQILNILILIGGFFVSISLLLIYHYNAFGSPFLTPYHFRVIEDQIGNHAEGYAGVSYPKLWPLINLLFLPSKGILFFMPIIYLSLINFYKAIKIKNAEMILAGCILVVYIIYNASIKLWSGDCCYGPRFLKEALPFAIILIALNYEKYEKYIVYLFYYSFMISLIGLFYKFACVPLEYRSISFIYYIVNLLQTGIKIPIIIKIVEAYSIGDLLLTIINYIAIMFIFTVLTMIIEGFSINNVKDIFLRTLMIIFNRRFIAYLVFSGFILVGFCFAYYIKYPFNIKIILKMLINLMMISIVIELIRNILINKIIISNKI